MSLRGMIRSWVRRFLITGSRKGGKRAGGYQQNSSMLWVVVIVWSLLDWKVEHWLERWHLGVLAKLGSCW